MAIGKSFLCVVFFAYDLLQSVAKQLQTGSCKVLPSVAL